MNGKIKCAPLAALLLALVTVFSQWNFWQVGTQALGMNTALVGMVFIAGLLLHRWHRQGAKHTQLWPWLLPIVLMILSFAVFENAWLKNFTVIVCPIACALFYALSRLRPNLQPHWDEKLMTEAAKHALTPLKKPFKPTLNALSSAAALRVLPWQRIATGALFAVPAVMGVVVLLSAADKQFGVTVVALVELLFGVVHWSVLLKLMLVVLLAIFIPLIWRRWNRPLNITQEQRNGAGQVDAVISGIVISSVLCVYLIFLKVQLAYAFADQLPQQFSAAESLVKNGFWQLFVLSIINACIVIWLNQRSTKTVQMLLRAYVIASSLLLLSAAWRVALYALTYSLSYEKFFASYTCAFAMLVFAYLVYCSLSSGRHNVLKVLCYAALWGYSIATVLPIERIIMGSNVALSQRVGSQVDLAHLKNMSIDVYAAINGFKATNSKQFGIIDSPQRSMFTTWASDVYGRYCDRPWYEANLSRWLNCSSR